MGRLLGRGVVLAEKYNPLEDAIVPEYVPPTWNLAHVGTRLTDGWRTLTKMPLGRFGPRDYQHCWPGYRIEWDELLAMVGAGELEAFQREQNRTRDYPSAKQIAQMDCTFGWPGAYLRGAVELVLCLNLACWARAARRDLEKLIARRSLLHSQQTVLAMSWQACDVIARGLNGDEVGVF